MHSARHWLSSHKTLIVLLLVLLVISLFWARALSQQAGESVVISESVAQDQYLAGQVVRVNASVDGDVTAAGREVAVEGAVSGDVIVAGERIDIAANVSDDVRAAGRRIDLHGDVAGHVVAAGAEVTLNKGSSVGDWAWFAGRRVDVRGAVGEDLRAAGETVVVSGTVAGDADIVAENFRLEPGASIAGDLVWRGTREPDISPDATVGGELIRKPIERDIDRGPSIFGALFVVVSLLLLAMAVGLIFPDFGASLGDVARARPWLALGVAVLVLLITPPLIALCFATGIGFVIALILLLAFLIVVISGTPLGMLAIAHIGSARFNKPITSRGSLLGALLLVALIIWVVSWIPVLGGLALLVVWLLGIGTAEIHGYRRFQAN